MPEPLKNVYSQQFIQRLAETVKKAHPEFESDSFIQHIFTPPWDDLELKQRMRRITESLRHFLPDDYRQSLTILKKAAPSFSGFEAMFFPEFVELYGQDDWQASLPALEHFTQFSSSEFAVRPFIKADSSRMMDQMIQWATHENYHVRRLASEGCRPRLPWAMALPSFKQDPAPILPILEQLKQDPELYVRRSVANNLNDISKDNPDLVLELGNAWMGHHPDTDWIVKHACRTLLKAGNPKAMTLFGYGDAKHINLQNFALEADLLNIGDTLTFSFQLELKQAALMRLEYAVYYLKANGSHSRKVFKITEGAYDAGITNRSRNQRFADLSTRKHHPGQHFLALVVNGVELAKESFQLDP